jgi:GTP-binding protein
MIIHSAEYIGSFPTFDKLPEISLPEFCFWGRSNVGKSSLINYLFDRKNLALTSSTPGKTININLFHINENIAIVDLPGYGYAQISRSKRTSWLKEIEKYLVNRKNLMNVFLLIDITIPVQKIDLEKINYLGLEGIPFTILFTKSDKCRKIELKHNLKVYELELSKTWENLPIRILTSVENRVGRQDVLEIIEANSLRTHDLI